MDKIGVFDSGIGGLTVMHALREAFPGQDMIYLGDVARVPYGGRSDGTILKFAREDAAFLLGKDVSAVLIACNTVSATALETLRSELPVPVWGVIDAAAHRALAATRRGVVGVIGTQATINSGAYERALRSLAPLVRVVSRACPLFVPLIENGIGADDPVAEEISRRYLAAFDGTGVDTLIMGCTHYPVYRDIFARLLPGVTLVHCGEALAEELAPTLAAGRQGAGQVEYYVTERSAAFRDTLRVMDAAIDPADIHVDNSFI